MEEVKTEIFLASTYKITKNNDFFFKIFNFKKKIANFIEKNEIFFKKSEKIENFGKNEV